MKLSIAAALSASILIAMPASAATVITGTDALREWNLIVLGNLSSSSEVEGRTFVGGNLSGGSSNYQIRTPAASSNAQPGLTVVGNVVGSTKNLNAGGAVIGGNLVSGVNMNGAPQTLRVGGTIQNTNVNQNIVQSGLASTPGFTSGLTAQRDALVTSMIDLSGALAQLTPTASVSIANNRALFDAAGNGIAVFSLTAAQLGQFGEIQFNRNGFDTVVVNVSGSAITLNDNFLGNSDGLGSNVIWNFADATSLNLTTAWHGSVLAPNAAATTANFIQGSAVFGSLIQNGEIHLGAYSGGTLEASAVPEPASWAMMIGGFGLVGGAMRRRRVVAARVAYA
jgi:choice-of-anchor A domain-containing protein